jgi:hypothetical protein
MQDDGWQEAVLRTALTRHFDVLGQFGNCILLIKSAASNAQEAIVREK